MRTDSTSSITGAIITAVATAALISNVSGVWTCPSEREPFCCGKYSNVDEDPMAVIGIECVNAPRNDNCTDGVPVQCCKPMVGVVSSPLLSIISTIETCFRSYPDMCINFILFLTFPPLFLHIGRPCHISNSNMRHYFFPPRTRSRNHRRIPSHTRIRGRVITAIARLLDMVRVSGSNSELEG
ncbi:hypothetical protein I7I50_01447 [Histoplasma capsulatum G186AR]|uniref:Hydrophobin n=1 Tax=Ajellomyces capsulatus TaxID=5037 RepID=A0A8H8CTB7_AJECA|nr:hypothetical protein I7I52_12563 [Histoplasma capsulatum]QSS73324.1 hypothetical protein I7I50_01447 [Histoplasma capsulatum G186AR]